MLVDSEALVVTLLISRIDRLSLGDAYKSKVACVYLCVFVEMSVRIFVSGCFYVVFCKNRKYRHLDFHT